MDVGRQSMYDTFGDKRALFLRALETYVNESVNTIRDALEGPWRPALAAVQKLLSASPNAKTCRARKAVWASTQYVSWAAGYGGKSNRPRGSVKC